MLLADGEHTTMKEGNKIPIATGTYANGAAATSPSSEIQTQFTYLDVGMNFDATISVSGTSVRLKSKVEDSSLDQPVTIAGVTEPVVRQSVLDGTSILTLGQTRHARHHRHSQHGPPHGHSRPHRTNQVKPLNK